MSKTLQFGWLGCSSQVTNQLTSQPFLAVAPEVLETSRPFGPRILNPILGGGKQAGSAKSLGKTRYFSLRRTHLSRGLRTETLQFVRTRIGAGVTAAAHSAAWGVA